MNRGRGQGSPTARLQSTRSLLLSACACAAVLAVGACRSAPEFSIGDSAAANPPRELRQWEYRWGDSPFDEKGVPQWTLGGDPDAWRPIEIPAAIPEREGRSLVWMRAALPRNLWRDPAVYTAGIDYNYEAYLDGKKISGFGRIDRNGRGQFVGYSSLYIDLPSGYEGKTLYLRIYSDHESIGPFDRVLIGSRPQLLREGLEGFLGRFAVAVVLVCLGLGCLVVHARARSQRVFLWLGLYALNVGVYLIARTEFREWLLDSPMTWHYLELLTLFAIPLTHACFVRAVLRPDLVHRLIQVVSLAFLGFAVGWAALGHHVLGLLIFWQIGVIPMIVASIASITRSALGGDPEARILVAGIALAAASGIPEILRVLRVFPNLQPTVHWGFGVLICCLVAVMVRRFAETQRQLARLNEELREQVTQQTEQLRAKSLELEALDTQKSQFFQNVSHELRTPLTLILGPLDAARAQSPSDKNLEVALRNSRRLYRLVDQLLDFQRLAVGKRKLDLKAINLVPFIASSASYVAPACKTRNIQFSAFIDGAVYGAAEHGEAWVLAEVDALEKVVFNLLSNAMKHAPRGGAVELRLRTQGRRFARISVRDTGQGIPEEDRDKLFKVFSQLEGASTPAHEGSGLGLALVRELAEAMNGSVGVASAVGEGSTFWVDLPLADPGEKGTEERFAFDQTLLDAPEESAVESPAPASAAQTGGARILVVDDLADMRLLVARVLQKDGHQTILAPNGRKALEQALADPPDLIVTDWMMPVMDGPGLIRAVRADERLASIPVVLLTAKSEEESRSEGVSIGADHFLGKPFSEEELSSAVRNLLQLKRREREVEALNRHLTEDVMKRFLAPTVVDGILDGRIALESEPTAATITTLVADMVGFASLTERLDPGDMARILNEFFSVMTGVVFRHAGTIDKFIGDALVVLFGAPVSTSVEEQVRSAVACARDMQREMRRLAERWAERKAAGETGLRIGIHTGPVVVGSFGGALRMEYTAVGASVDLASRAQAACTPNSIFVTAQVREHLGEGEAVHAGDLELEDREAPARLYRVGLQEAREGSP